MLKEDEIEAKNDQKVGLKKNWRFYKGRYKNEYLFQFINHVL